MSMSMEAFHWVRLYDADETVMLSSDWIVLSKVNYCRRWELFERWEAAAVIAHVLLRFGINDPE